jgi:sulfur-oxidizing protein SoxX
VPDVTALALVVALVGDPAQGQAIAASRSTGLCVLCHAMPGVPAVHSGNLGPDLAGVGARYDRAQLRERFLVPDRFNPQSVMPSPLRSDGLQRVAAARAGQGVLTPQQAADVLAWLETLR